VRRDPSGLFDEWWDNSNGGSSEHNGVELGGTPSDFPGVTIGIDIPFRLKECTEGRQRIILATRSCWALVEEELFEADACGKRYIWMYVKSNKVCRVSQTCQRGGPFAPFGHGWGHPRWVDIAVSCGPCGNGLLATVF
jgi:hypothetical protein